MTDDFTFANQFAVEGDGFTVTLAPRLDGAVAATMTVRGRDIDAPEATSEDGAWLVSATTESAHDDHFSRATVRLPPVKLDDGGGQEVTALLTVVTTHTNIGGLPGAHGQLETYDAAVLHGTADFVES